MSTSQSVGVARDPDQGTTKERLEQYLLPELEKLTLRSERFEQRANRWYLFVGLTLTAGAVFALCLGGLTLFRAAAPITHVPIPPPTWQEVVRNIASSLIVLGLLGAVVRFAYVMGKSCMVESIRNNNRRHAISFGEFYLKAFGDKLNWSEAKDAFASWNIDIGSSFLTQSASDVDPQFLQSVTKILLAMGKKAGEKE